MPCDLSALSCEQQIVRAEQCAALRKQHPTWSEDNLQKVVDLIHGPQDPAELTQRNASDISSTHKPGYDQLPSTMTRSTVHHGAPMDRRSVSIAANLAQKRGCDAASLSHSSMHSSFGVGAASSFGSMNAQSRMLENVQEYSPDEYVGRIAPDDKNARPAVLPMKRRRVDASRSARASQSSSLCSQWSAPVMTPDTSCSSLVSPLSIYSDPMSRQVSDTDALLAGNFDMMRVGSRVSFGSPNSSLPCTCPSFSAAQWQNGFPAGCEWRVPELDHGMGLVGSTVGSSFLSSSFSSFDTDESMSQLPIEGSQSMRVPTQGCREPQPALMVTQDMNRQESSQSNSSTTSDSSARRRQKHLENALKQPLQPKAVPKEDKGSDLDIDDKDEPRSAQAVPMGRKKTRTRVWCDQCNESPKGFRGEHELSRHKERLHADERRVWICVTPKDPGEFTPARPLEMCSACRSGKHFEEYYNAVAHMRRLHYNPVSRGRKSNSSEPRRSGPGRAGSSGGSWPPNEFFRSTQWIVPVFVNRKGERIEPQNKSELTRGPFAIQASPKNITSALAGMDSFDEDDADNVDEEVPYTDFGREHGHLIAETLGLQEPSLFQFDYDDGAISQTGAEFEPDAQYLGRPDAIQHEAASMHWSFNIPAVVDSFTHQAFDFDGYEPPRR